MIPTEAAGVAAIYAIPNGYFICKGLNRRNFMEGLREASITIGVVMVTVFMVLIVSRFLIVTIRRRPPFRIWGVLSG